MNTVQTPWLTWNDVCKNSLIENAPSASAPFSSASVFGTPVFGAPAELDMPELDEEVVTKLSSRVILFNDEWHSFDEVIEQIIKATGCNYDKAEDLTLEVHNAGKAMVYEGDMGECLRVSNVLEEIMLRTQIEC
jgi:ATP-dependent Clp protease adapter protein ClpS